MSTKNRVVVTGVGAITPIGNDMGSSWNGLREKEVGIEPITHSDTTDYKIRLVVRVRGSDAENYMGPKAVKRMEIFSRFAMTVSKEALKDSGLDIDKENPLRIGVSVGSGTGSLQSMEKEHKRLLEKGPNRVNPLLVPMMTGNTAAGNAATQFSLKGKCTNVVTVCATDTYSIGEALRSIQYGKTEVMLTGGTEISTYPIGTARLTTLTALNTTEDPMRALTPFDGRRSGFVIGKGIGVAVLESLRYAKVQGVHIYAEVVGYGATCDAYRVTSPTEGGSGTATIMIYAIQDVGMAPGDINYINTHGTSAHRNDLFETKAIKTALSDHAYDVHISSTKSTIGHLLGAAGGVEFTICVKSIEEGYVHVTAGLEIDDGECDLNCTKGEGVSTPVRYAISNSLGFGGHNASILVKRSEGQD